MRLHPFWTDTALFVTLLSSLTVLTACSGGGGGGGGVVEGGSTAKAWHTPVLLETDNAGDANRPRIVMDASGNALAVWCQSDGTRYNIWANRYTAGSGWGTAGLIETDNAGNAVLNAVLADIAVDANGNPLAVWQQWDGVRYNIWANRFE